MIVFGHYGLGLSNGFSQDGQNAKILKMTYFTLLLAYISYTTIPNIIQAYRGELLEAHVGGLVCLLKRYHCCQAQSQSQPHSSRHIDTTSIQNSKVL